MQEVRLSASTASDVLLSDNIASCVTVANFEDPENSSGLPKVPSHIWVWAGLTSIRLGL